MINIPTLRTLTVCLTLVIPSFVVAQDFPVKPIRLIVPNAPGGGLDVIARVVGPKLSELLGQPVVVENRPGAGSMIGTRQALSQPQDGHTVLINATSMALNSYAYKSPGYTMRDFVPLGAVGTNPFLLLARADLPAKSIQELVAHSKQRGVNLNAVTLGPATVTNLCYERFKRETGFTAVSIPYPGSAPGQQALLSQTTDVMMAGVDALALLSSGKVRVIGVTTSERWSSAPEARSFREQGLQTTCQSWASFFHPAGAPRHAVARMRDALGQVLSEPAMRHQVRTWGYEPWTAGIQQFEKFLDSELARWQRDIQDAKLSLE